MPIFRRRRGGIIGATRELTLDYDYLLDSGATIAQSVNIGPVPTFTRASNAMSFDSAGNLAFAPHQLLENSNWGTRTGDVPSGWAWQNETGAITWTDIGTYSEGLFSGTAQRQRLRNSVETLAARIHTAIVFIQDSSITSGNNVILQVVGTGGTDCDITDADWDSLGGVAGWYACAFEQGAADTNFSIDIGLGVQGNATGSVTINRPTIVIGNLTGAALNTPVLLSGEPLGRWIGTDDGDEPLYDQPRFVHDPAASDAQLGLLMEEARTNLCLQSSDFTTTWVNINTDEPTTNNTDIFGTTTADEIAATSTADQQFAIHQSFTGLTANTATAVAVYIKGGTNATFVQLAWDSDGGGSDGCFCNFQLTSAGTKGTVTAMTAGTATFASIDLIVEGFYRCVVVGNIITGTVGRFTINIIDRIDAVKFEAANLADNDSLIANAADVQVGAFMTSHIPTTTATVTRATDVPPTTTDVGGVNASNLSIFAQAIIPTVSAQERSLFTIDDGGTTDVIRLYMDAAENVNFETVNSGDTNGASDGAATIAANTVFKGMGTAEDDSVIGYVDGTASTEDTTAGIPVTDAATTIRIGGNSGSTVLNGYMQTAKMWNATKPSAFAVTETT